jgi:hypothetical protein
MCQGRPTQFMLGFPSTMRALGFRPNYRWTMHCSSYFIDSQRLYIFKISRAPDATDVQRCATPSPENTWFPLLTRREIALNRVRNRLFRARAPREVLRDFGSAIQTSAIANQIPWFTRTRDSRCMTVIGYCSGSAIAQMTLIAH